jgi:LysM repeat protein
VNSGGAGNAPPPNGNYGPVGQVPPSQNNVVRPPAPANPNGGRSIADVAAGMGETLVGLDGQPLRAREPLAPPGGAIVQNNAGNGPRTPHVAGGAMKQYTVQPGDSLSKIAQKEMGSNTKANRDAIVKANPSLAANPDKVIIGATYNIPPAASATTGTVIAQQPTQPRPATPAPPARPAAPVENFYTVQPGDNLTRIAKEQAGDVSMVAAIKELNKEAVKDWNVLQVGTKLRLPGKSVASAN